jgi:hypothetical protein
LTKKETNFSSTLSEAVSVATSVAYTRQEIQKLKTEFVSLLEKKTAEVIVEQVPGPVGPRGALGATGAQGPKGDKGDKGDVGERGEKGDVGQQGEIGPEGPQGIKGDKGDIGPQGIQGITGERGEKGDKGEDGKNGLDGRDGEAGNIGPAGPAGAQGIQGERGEKGDRGDRGESGKDGQQGIQGSVGPRGEIGPQGIQGLPGKDGKDADVKAIEQSISKFKEVLQKDVSQYKAKVNTIISSGIGGGSHGGGEVNLRRLDDVDTTNLTDGYVLAFNESTQKFEFVEGGTGGGTVDTIARTRANNAWNTANSAYLQANSAYNQANSANSLAQAAYNYANTLSGSGTDNLARSIANSAYATANTKSYTFSQNTAPATANSNDFWANTDSAVVYYNFGNTSSPLWVEFGPTGTSTSGGNTDLTGYAVNTTVNLIWSTANLAYTQANTGTTLAQAAYNYANTIIVPSLSGYAVNTTVNTIWSTTNSAYTQANTATTLAQAAYNYANTIVVPSLSGYAVNAIVDIVWSNSNSAFSTANASYNQANTATTNASNADVKAQAAYNYANTIVVPSLSGYATNTTVNLVWSTANSAYTQANLAFNTANSAWTTANTQSDWNVSDNTSVAFIKNKPTLVTTLNDLSDATIVSPLNEQVLVYNTATGQWINQAIGISANNLTTGYFGGFFYNGANVALSNTSLAYTVPISSSYDGTNGVTIGGNNDILIAYAGTYHVEYSIQFENNGNSEDAIDIWVRVNGVNVANSASKFSIHRKNGNDPGFLIAVTPLLLTCNAADRIQFEVSSSTGQTKIASYPTQIDPTTPAIPAVIANVQQVSSIVIPNDITGTANNANYLGGYAANTYATTATTNTIATNVASAWSTANSAFAQANSAWAQANTGGAAGTDNVARSIANSAFSTANSAFAKANTGTSQLVNDASTVSLSANGNLTVPGPIGGLGNAKLDFTTYGANVAYLTTTSDDSTALYMGSVSAELYAHTNILIRTNTAGVSKNWTFGADGSTTLPGTVDITYTPDTATGSAITINGANTQGGTGYFDFLRATNTTSGATNPNKTFRLNSTGAVEIINSAYTATLFNLSDAGNLSISGDYQVNGKKAVNGPAFRAYVATGQAITSGSQQKVTFGTENFDTNNNFASSRFTPTIEGYYQLNATIRIDGTSSTGEVMIILYKNGSEYARGHNQSGTEQGASFYSMSVSDIAYANGSTDYFEVYIQQSSGGNRNTTAGSPISYFSGSMIRGA